MKFTYVSFICVTFHFLIGFLNSQTIAVAEIVRHGARSTKTFPNLASRILYGTEEHQLTPNGFLQHYELGKKIKAKFSDFLALKEDKTSDIKINIISSPRQRCIASATAHTLGMFPNSDFRYSNQNKNFEFKEDDVPPGFERKKSNRSFLKDSKETEEAINIEIVDPLKDSIFHAENCQFKDKIKNLPEKSEAKRISKSKNKALIETPPDFLGVMRVNEIVGITNSKEKEEDDLINQFKGEDIFKLTDQEIKEANDAITLGLIDAFSELIQKEEWKFKDIKNAYRLLSELVQFVVPIRYHFVGEHLKKLTFSESVESTIRKEAINHFYSKKINHSPAQILLVNDMMKKVITNFEDSNNKSYTLFAGHDTNLVNLITFFLDHDKLRTRLKKASTDQAEFDSLIPPFASQIIFELYKEAPEKIEDKLPDTKSTEATDGGNGIDEEDSRLSAKVKDDKTTDRLYIRVYYNNSELKQDWRVGIDYINGKGIALKQFTSLIKDNLYETTDKSWVCPLKKIN